jgi:hypothetical protein
MKYDYETNAAMLSQLLKMVKIELPSNCTFLAPVKKSSGEVFVKAVIKDIKNKKATYLYTIPQHLAVTNADLERIKELITAKCTEDVS